MSDDGPSNDIQGYISLANAFVAIDDDVNALAVFQFIRPVKNGVAVLASDKNGSGAMDMADAGELGKRRRGARTGTRSLTTRSPTLLRSKRKIRRS